MNLLNNCKRHDSIFRKCNNIVYWNIIDFYVRDYALSMCLLEEAYPQVSYIIFTSNACNFKQCVKLITVSLVIKKKNENFQFC